jgi:hypothetical protein
MIAMRCCQSGGGIATAAIDHNDFATSLTASAQRLEKLFDAAGFIQHGYDEGKQWCIPCARGTV